jgi:hypothetical protein
MSIRLKTERKNSKTLKELKKFMAGESEKQKEEYDGESSEDDEEEEYEEEEED